VSKMSEKGDQLREAAQRADEIEALEEEQRARIEELKRSWLISQPTNDHSQIEKDYAYEFDISLSDAKKQLLVEVKKYEIEGNDIPAIIKGLRKYRRTLKGDNKKNITSSIDNLIKAYSDHIDKSIDNIYWLAKYKPIVKEMNCNETDLIKLSLIDKEDKRREMVDILCKYWEDKLDKEELSFGSEFAKLTKEMGLTKREFKKNLKNIKISKNQKEQISEHILKAVSQEPGISSRQIHERLPRRLFKKTTPSMISKIAIGNDITHVDGAFYKFDNSIKKDIYAYTAAFIDSDGYITMDKNFNPRVGLIATGDRGKAFMLEMKKSLGIGRLHLDQKSPQDTRPVNRLNFYSAKDVGEILTKCLPHFKLKKSNAEILLELIRMKKSHKKADWYTDRKEELFKLMKYENHKDNINYDFAKYNIDIDTVAKLHDNCKMLEMDRIEGVVV
tara:strand:- start:167 stop:1501 length:1335 start_codon:yes stop_codon:yes gene_type:complete